MHSSTRAAGTLAPLTKNSLNGPPLGNFLLLNASKNSLYGSIVKTAALYAAI